MDDSAIFCSNCGNRLPAAEPVQVEEAVAEEPETAVPEAAEPEVDEPEAAEPVYEAAAAEETPAEPEPAPAPAPEKAKPEKVRKVKRNRKKGLLKASITFLILALVTGGVYAVYLSGVADDLIDEAVDGVQNLISGKSGNSDSDEEEAEDTTTESEAFEENVSGMFMIDISDECDIQIPDQNYTGAAIEPELSIAVKNIELTEGTDYTVTYENNVRPGTADYTVTGIGRFTGTCEGTFVITTGNATADDPANSGMFDFVEELYNNALGRSASANDQAYCISSMISGEQTPASVVLMIFASEEFNANGYSDEEFLNYAYTSIFQREADSEGYQFFLEQLQTNAMSRTEVVNFMTGSDEFIALCEQYGI